MKWGKYFPLYSIPSIKHIISIREHLSRYEVKDLNPYPERFEPLSFIFRYQEELTLLYLFYRENENKIFWRKQLEYF